MTDRDVKPDNVSKSDPELGMRRCKSCGAPILWTVTESGKAMPVDFAPSSDGTIVIAQDRDGGRRVWRSHVARLDEPPSVRRKSHYASCPDAEKWRRR